MKVHTDYLWFTTEDRQQILRITDDVAGIVNASGVSDGTVLVSAMHITAGLPYKHHQTGEDNADAHLKRTIVGHQVVVPITGGRLDLGP